MRISAPHPFDLEVQDFGSYSRILDLRRQEEWLAGNIPGSLCHPAISAANERVLDDMIRRGHFDDLESTKREMVRQQIDSTIEAVKNSSGNDHILVYCSRGGYRSQYALEALTRHNLSVTVLRGGWSAYRQWVQSALDTFSMMLHWLPLSSVATHSDEESPQILDIDAIINSPRLQVFLDTDGRIPRSIFESDLLEMLRHFDRSNPVYFSPVSPSSMLPAQLPAGLIRVMRQMQAFDSR